MNADGADPRAAAAVNCNRSARSPRRSAEHAENSSPGSRFHPGAALLSIHDPKDTALGSAVMTPWGTSSIVLFLRASLFPSAYSASVCLRAAPVYAFVKIGSSLALF